MECDAYLWNPDLVIKFCSLHVSPDKQKITGSLTSPPSACGGKYIEKFILHFSSDD